MNYKFFAQPVQLKSIGNDRFKSVACGSKSTILLHTRYHIYFCGSNEYGQGCIPNLEMIQYEPKKIEYFNNNKITSIIEIYSGK
jgi:alpha-tubulin suppressor-like RCC1 family protein